MSGAERSGATSLDIYRGRGREARAMAMGSRNQIVSIAIQRHKGIAVSCMCWSCAVAVKAKVLYDRFLGICLQPRSRKRLAVPRFRDRSRLRTHRQLLR